MVDRAPQIMALAVDVGYATLRDTSTSSTCQRQWRKPRMCITLRRLSGYRTYICTAKRIASGDDLKQRNGSAGMAISLFYRAAMSHRRGYSDRASQRNRPGQRIPADPADRVSQTALEN